MRKLILFLIFCITIALIFISCKTKSTDDQLAERMAKSQNFKGIMMFWKENGKLLIKLPDITKQRLTLNKILLDSLQKNNHLNLRQKADSILKIGRSEPTVNRLISDTQNTKNLILYFKGFNIEFPEFKNMPKEERSIVFKKAASFLKKDFRM